MAISKTKAAETAQENYNVKVTRVKDFTKDGKTSISFDLNVNGVTIYGMWYREYTSKEGKDGSMLSFPSQKANDGKYYNHAFFPINAELKAAIEKQIESML